MSHGTDLAPESVAPPGWSAPAVPVLAPARPAGVPAATEGSVVEPAEAAVRWRIRAARIDNLIVYGAYVLVCGLLHWRVAAWSHLWVLALGGVAYHFVLEAHDGQTIGKRRYGIRVVSLDGGAPSVQAVAIRSVLRIVDQLPLWYLSGLLNMVRTGPARRQRIGDVAAGTMVVATGRHAAAQGTPRWLLPAATLFALAFSAVGVIAVTQAGTQPLSSVQQAAFVSNCQNSPGGQLLDCECLLNRLEAAGYVTPRALDDLVAQAETPTSPNPARAVLESAGAACRR